MSHLMEIAWGGVRFFFFQVETVSFFTVGHHTEQSVNKIKYMECLKFVL